MTTVGQFHKPCVRFVLTSEENLRDFVLVTLSALLRALFPAKTNTGMLATKKFFARLITTLPVTSLAAQSGAYLMFALPGAFLIARFARFATSFLALTVFAGVSAAFFARWAVSGTGFRAVVATE